MSSEQISFAERLDKAATLDTLVELAAVASNSEQSLGVIDAALPLVANAAEVAELARAFKHAFGGNTLIQRYARGTGRVQAIEEVEHLQGATSPYLTKGQETVQVLRNVAAPFLKIKPGDTPERMRSVVRMATRLQVAEDLQLELAREANRHGVETF